jgi:hypothetical protein
VAWVKVPPEHHPLFHAALPEDPRVQTMLMFGGVAAKVNGHIFAGLFGRSVMIWLPEPDRTAALALEGAGPFDPMGNGRVMSEKVMLPEAMMEDPPLLRSWIARAFRATALLPRKADKPRPAAKKPAQPAGKGAAEPMTKTAGKATRKPTAKAGSGRAKPGPRSGGRKIRSTR